MDAEVVTIGNELLLGFTLDRNAAHLATALSGAGVRVRRHATVPDEADAIRDAVAGGLARSGFVVTTGGLGPTRDDVTKQVVADIFEAPLELDETYLDRLRQRFDAMGRGPMPASNRSQAEVPRGATVLANPRGTAPGLWIEGARGVAVLLPGVPREMRGILSAEVLPRLVDRAAGGVVTRSRVLRTTGVAESYLADQLARVDEAIAPVTLAYLPGLAGVDLRFTVWRVAPEEAERRLAAALETVRPRVERWVYGEGETDLAAVVLSDLGRAGHRLATAESCTGGLIGARLTAVPGASTVYQGGVVSYSDASKQDVLDVAPERLARHGAVSEEVARAMVDGALARFAATAAVAVTGIAGPDGGTPEKPVGTVWIAARCGGEERTVRVVFPGDRHDIRHRTAQGALDVLRRLATRS